MFSPSLLHIKNHQFTDLRLPILRFLNATCIVLYEKALIPGLLRLGGLDIIIEKLGDLDPVIRTSSAWVIGKATQNNPLVQKQVLELGALAKLMVMVKSSNIEEAIKALYAVSSLIRSNLYGEELFYANGGVVMLQEILSNASSNIRLRKKLVLLVADLTEGQSEARRNKEELHFFSDRFFLKSVVDLTESSDLDLQEKALYAIKNLLHLGSTEALVQLKDFCALDGALERMRKQLMVVDEDEREYAIDVESLRREVELIFLDKLNKVATEMFHF